MNSLNSILFALAVASLSAACGDSGSEGPESKPTNPSNPSGGTSKCGAVTCEAGQHCNNVICEAGCLSNENCASDQTCEDVSDVTHVGTCKNKTVAPTKDCATFCTKSKACVPGTTDAKCQQACEALSEECVSCINDSNCGNGCESLCKN